jgi:hypothetical protein
MSSENTNLSNDDLIKEYKKNVGLFMVETVKEEKDRLNHKLGDLMSEIVRRNISV